MVTATATATATEIILEYVCPSLGLIVANMMFAAPLRDLQKAVSLGQGLGDLNPTPWAFMLGNCLGWTTYGIITNNWFIFWANYPGFLISCWLNLGAVKLLYSHHHQQVARTSIVNYLSSATQQLQSQSQQDIRNRMGSLALLSVDDDDEIVAVVDNDDDDDDDDDNNYDNNDKIATKIDYGYGSTNNNNNSNNNTEIETETPPQAAAAAVSQNANEWAKVIWDVTSQTTPAKTPHENLIMGIILLWTLVLSGIGFYGVITMSNGSGSGNGNGNGNGNGSVVDTGVDGDTYDDSIPQMIVGVVVNINLVFFYGAPLSAINTVIKTKTSNRLHVPTMITNTMCSIFWTAYAVAPQINDPFIYVPNGLGVVLGVIQFILYIIFPNSNSNKNKNNKNKQSKESNDNDNDNNNDKDNDNGSSTTPESKTTSEQQQHTDATTVVDV